ncbi:FtsW/RodA/SpoVE family cell cycle protein [Actinoalloteichus hymeniacidonis]|uniref:Bacterial cell division membrane protein n=1 Tax=Actinoalloteichus hymeniacidonis TaxID=340345 RepID=A0AAC9HK70_9PSEU|nr:FtsW/RodA/SpoVE family cell cycle protein [Actinoalloteichus hymeniacidonis]AOS60877.1 bacterial cell division membrane protein [Actinoalloteichus hymeniacidonis]MBB5911123.1 cell division protein FtsW (lipid II flippase) [Actinoalloteichus hymeniacidonis]
MSSPVDATSNPGQAATPSPPAVPTRRNTELLMLAFAAILVTIANVLVEANQEQELSTQLLYNGAAFLALFGIAHLAVRKWAPYADPLILPFAALLNGVGLIAIYRIDLADAAADPDHGYLVNRQIGWMVISVVLFVLILAFVKDHRLLARFGYTCGFVGLIALALPGFLPASMSSAGGAKIWIRIGGAGIQPGEFAKILLMIFFASFLVSKRDLFTVAGRRFLGMDFPRMRDMAPMLLAWAASVGVLVFERDLGTSLLFFGLVLVMIYVATERVSWVVIGLSLFAIGCVIAYPLFNHLRVRVLNWMDPLGRLDATDGDSFQLVQSLFGLGTGGIFGTGLGSGRPTLIPAAETDFIISAIGEEIGFVGVAAVLLLYLLLVMRGLRTALAVRDSFGKLLASGLAFIIGLQVFIVVGGATRLIPSTGITAPFLSYGGSSLLANYILVALLLLISHAARKPQPPSKPRPQQAPLAEAHTEMVARPT